MIFLYVALINLCLAQDLVISPGEARLVQLKSVENGDELFCDDQKIKMNKEKDGKSFALIVENYFSEETEKKCQLKNGLVIKKEIVFKVIAKKYPEEKLQVDMKTIKLSKKDELRAFNEQKVLNKLYAESPEKSYFKSAFIEPLDSLKTSLYGSKRIYNNHKKSQHLGTDYRAQIGVVIPAANAGKVVFAGDLFYTGWTVIIDHGLDIFSVYGHLSKVSVQAGQMVTRGEKIGLSGNTGRTSGPHLHWGTKVQGHYIDGLSLIEETKKIND